MSEFFGNNAQLIEDGLGQKIAPGQVNARLKVMKEKHVFEQDILAINDTIRLGAKLPKGAKVVDAVVTCASTGTTGIFKLGYKATEADVTDRTGDLGSGYDSGGQAVATVKALNNDALSEEKEVIATLTEATDNAEDVELNVSIRFTVD